VQWPVVETRREEKGEHGVVLAVIKIKREIAQFDVQSEPLPLGFEGRCVVTLFGNDRSSLAKNKT